MPLSVIGHGGRVRPHRVPGIEAATVSGSVAEGKSVRSRAVQVHCAPTRTAWAARHEGKGLPVREAQQLGPTDTVLSRLSAALMGPCSLPGHGSAREPNP